LPSQSVHDSFRLNSMQHEGCPGQADRPDKCNRDASLGLFFSWAYRWRNVHIPTNPSANCSFISQSISVELPAHLECDRRRTLQINDDSGTYPSSTSILRHQSESLNTDEPRVKLSTRIINTNIGNICQVMANCSGQSLRSVLEEKMEFPFPLWKIISTTSQQHHLWRRPDPHTVYYILLVSQQVEL